MQAFRKAVKWVVWCGFLSWFISIQFHYRSCRSRKSKDAGSNCSIYISITHTQLSLQERTQQLAHNVDWCFW